MAIDKKKTTNELALVSGGADSVLCSASSCKADYSTTLQNLQEEISERFQNKKAHSEYLSKIYNELCFESKASRVFSCGTFLEFKVSEKEAKLQNANFCKDRLCPMCNWRRSLKIFSQVSTVMDNMPDEYEYLFLTLTVRNCETSELKETIDALLDGWRFLYNKEKVFRKAVSGSFRSLEVTRNDDTSSAFYGTFHPHLHCILAVKKSYFKKHYITQKQWSELWKKACDLEYKPIVHIEKVYLKDSNGKKLKDEIDLKKAVVESSKYAVKSSDYLFKDRFELSCDTVEALLGALSGRRLCGWTGVFNDVRKKLKLDDAEQGDLVITSEDENIREDVACMLVRYQWRCGSYVSLR